MRSAFDKLISFTGLALVAVLLAAGGLLVWANSFIGNQVHDQLVMQDITMPTGDATAELPKADQDALAPYAGSKLDTGPEAKAFADHYILVHMNAASDGQTYAEVSGEYIQLTDERQGQPRRPGARPAAPDPVHGQHPARPAALRLRLRHHGHHRWHTAPSSSFSGAGDPRWCSSGLGSGTLAGSSTLPSATSSTGASAGLTVTTDLPGAVQLPGGFVCT